MSRRGFSAVPRHLRARDGKGWREDQASGFIRYAEDYVLDVRQGAAARDYADLTPGFGTHHPSDVIALGVLDDPSPVPEARPAADALSKQDLGYTDADVEQAVKEGRPLR